jgi:NADH:ubiquinone reductase (H+-translocating)
VRDSRVVIVGSGFGGLAAAKALRRAQVEVTVIDRTNHHLFQPLLYQMATGIVAGGEIAPAHQGHPPSQREHTGAAR